jgi:copper oxidase (laccase) domain-containing protein
MLRRDVRAGGVVVYVSPALERVGVPHGFSTRVGGVSEGVFGTMNLGNPSGVEVQDDEGRIDENYRRLQGSIGVGARERCSVHQVHGPGVVRVREGCRHDRKIKADALVTTDGGRVLSVRVADCVPVLMASEDGRVVAAVGPSIGEEAFEVGDEVVAEFDRVFGAEAPVRRRADGKGHVDLKEAIRRQLLAAEVREVDVTDRCSYRDADEFFSHRRENGVTGRMAAVIGVRA